MIGDKGAKILGIVNITEDSFSDGGEYLDPQRALAHARRLIAEGADIIDLGPASSHPEARDVSAEEEVRRIAPLIDALAETSAEISVDTWQPETQRYAMDRGVAYLNDVRGFAFPDFYAELAAGDCTLVLMHSIEQAARATRETAETAAVVRGIDEFFDARLDALERAGVARERVVLDPGMGLFLGADPETSIAVLRGLESLEKRFGLPVLVSVSRKSFLGAISGRDIRDRSTPTLAAELYAISQGADFIRTHDVRQLRGALDVLAALSANGG